MDEFARIEYWNKDRQSHHIFSNNGVVVGIGDDAAVVDLNLSKLDSNLEWQLVYTVDTMMETIHFNSITMSDHAIGYKAAASAISDLAAMGAIPMHILLSVAVPEDYTVERINDIYDGIYECTSQYGVAVIGGDTIFSPKGLVISVTAAGAVEKGKALLRSGAKPGDTLILTGVPGLSAAGLDYLLNSSSCTLPESAMQRLITAHQYPKPHISAGRLLLEMNVCHALNDVSDGLASEAYEIAKASNVCLVIEEEKLPVHDALSQYAVMRNKSVTDWMLYGGEDYILLAAIASSKSDEIQLRFKEHGLSCYEIGYVREGSGQVYLSHFDIRRDGIVEIKLQPKGYNHFTK